MLIYIIGKITGNQEYREQFARAEEALRAVYACDIINPAGRGEMMSPNNGYEFLPRGGSFYTRTHKCVMCEVCHGRGCVKNDGNE